MRIVVVGATGNVGTSVLEALGRDGAVSSILGLARRLPEARYAKTEFAAADETVRELLQGLADRAGGATPPLRTGDRGAEIAAGVGGKSV